MALLEKLEPGNVYLVKISASNQVGDGPFSNIVELVPTRGNTHRSKNPRHSDSFPDTTSKHHETLEHALWRHHIWMSLIHLSYKAGSYVISSL